MRLAILCVLALAGCAPDRRVEILEADYARAITTGDQCRLAGQIAALYLEKSDEMEYRLWKLARDLDCQSVALFGNELVKHRQAAVDDGSRQPSHQGRRQ